MKHWVDVLDQKECKQIPGGQNPSNGWLILIDKCLMEKRDMREGELVIWRNRNGNATDTDSGTLLLTNQSPEADASGWGFWACALLLAQDS